MYDLLIIGGGPAGLSAAMTARNRNLSVCVICGGAADSALYKAGRVTNYPGVPDVSGPALLETMTQQARDLGADMLRERTLSAMPMGKTFGVSAGKEFVEGRALLLATGIAQRGTFPGETDYLGRGVSYCATCDAQFFRGKEVAVIGYGREAEQEADYLAEIVGKVHYFPMGKEEPQLSDAVEVVHERPKAITGTQTVSALETDAGSHPVDGVFILRDAIAPSQLVPGLATEENHVKVNLQMETNLPGLFACGDITGKPYQYIKAAGQGNVAALSAAEYLDKKKREI